MPLFRFIQIEFPWDLGPPAGRYLMRPDGAPHDAEASEVIVFTVLGAPERHRLQRKRKKAEPEPEPVPVTVTRVTVVLVEEPFASEKAAADWLASAGEDDLDAGLAVLNRTLHVFRLVTADPNIGPVGRYGALVVRLGYGAGEQVSEGQWTSAIELIERTGRQTRAKVLTPQAHLAAVLTGKEARLACEELILRARLDFDSHRFREATLQVMIALDSAIAEISIDTHGPRLTKRLEELASLRDGIAEAGQTALTTQVSAEEIERVDAVLRRDESILRARAVLSA